VHIQDTYPYPLPDLFAGTQLVIVGRYREGGPALIQLNGTVNQQETRFVYEGFFEQSGGDRFIPRLWATRKIGYLLNQIRLHGESRELVDEIVELSIRYGIVTPYTSYLVQEEADVLTREGREAIVQDEFDALSAEPRAVVGAEAVEESEAKAAIESAEYAAAPPAQAAEVVRVVGDRTFVMREGVWTDTTFDPTRLTTEKIAFGGETYFELLAARPELGAYFSLGERVIVVQEDVAYEVAESDSGQVSIPPTPTASPVVPEETIATPTPVVVAANPTVVPVTPALQTAPQEDEGASLCPGSLLVGLVLLPVAGLRLRRRKTD
jgi:Ca-activated chloride channel family protein